MEGRHDVIVCEAPESCSRTVRYDASAALSQGPQNCLNLRDARRCRVDIDSARRGNQDAVVESMLNIAPRETNI